MTGLIRRACGRTPMPLRAVHLNHNLFHYFKQLDQWGIRRALTFRGEFVTLNPVRTGAGGGI
jgi:hypothetical protein